jgi:hypothetical protein
MTDTWNLDQNPPNLQARAIRRKNVLEMTTVTLEWIVGLGGLLVLAAAIFLMVSILNAQVNLHDINASGFWRP